MVNHRIKDVPQHCADLATFLSRGWLCPSIYFCEWLQIAAGIVAIDFSYGRLNQELPFDERPIQEEDAKSATLGPFIRELARFNFIWGALEGLIDILFLPRAPRRERSDIDAACFFIKSHFRPVPVPFPNTYFDLLSELRDSLLDHSHYESLTSQFTLCCHINAFSMGLHVVRKIRNQFAHGVNTFPTPPMYQWTQTADHRIITVSSSLLLLSAEMLIAAQATAAREGYDFASGFYTKEELDIELRRLMTIHLLSPEPFRDQLVLDFGEMEETEVEETESDETELDDTDP